ncbi:sulfatase family protein [Paenibacillus arenilitoris]|uniref:Sulfatase-like hydrolase/transferase n=1 Tax=Paenibacillus arenilitoris TaxID=2772299 RepID=A0A927CJ24_9BACL|nr:sulfatase-like hydrolase/transferase [Paenibacillus arenilitoris]MBD2869008.1 sulfatase-like hydrolase/transferase [Paenibacillus arenilitoris]
MKQPNILWICTDQQRFDTLGCYGNEQVRTPNIDRLASEGVRFEHAFCQATVCTPSRASFLTGRYPRTTRCRQNGQDIPEDERLVTRVLSDAGYVGGLSGKLHISACNPSVTRGTERRIKDGYDEFHWSHHPDDHWPTNEYIQWLQSKGKRYRPVPSEQSKYVQIGPDAEDHQTTWCAEKAITFMEANQQYDHPWFFSVNLFDPHHPFNPPASHLERYVKALEDIPLPNYAEGEPERKTYFQQFDHNGAYGEPKLYPYSKMNETDHRMIRAAYWAMIDLIDEQVGRMLDALERTGQKDNTIVVFMSDHGELLGDHGVYLKGAYFYEPSVRVPLIVSWPGNFASGTTCAELVELVDLAPTLLEAAGLPKEPGMQGKSLLPLLRDGRPEGGEPFREDVYCEHYNASSKQGGIGGFATMVRTARYKAALYHKRNEGELYDLERDPGETNNLWHDPGHADVKLQMLQRMCDRMAETVDPLPERRAVW